ncbi:MAG: ABC transporter ATP-binding protein [Clostridia bacterium]|nr:ABC transporter ATP-binding protein [Clostridia bacterium]
MKHDTIKESVASVKKGEVLLSVRDIHVFYGLIEAIKGVSFEVRRGEIIALIGANGAGKTTVMHTISGLIRPKSGSILLGGAEITQTPAHRIVSLGLAQVPEGRRVFQELTVYENLMLGAYVSSDKAENEAMLEKVYQRVPRLEERKKQSAGTLSGGEQQMLAMGRALMSRPEIILMDEPSMGLSPLYVNEVFDIIKEINGSGTTVLLVEQNAKKALAAADRAYVLETGRIALEGKASDLMDNAQVRRAYLGEE